MKTSNRIKIVRFFIENNEEEVSINKVAQRLKMNYRIAFEEIKKLEKEKIIKIKKIGNVNLCSFNFVLNEDVFKAESERKKEVLLNKDIGIVYERMQDIENPFFICLLFGSYAKKMQKKNSDIDIVVIADDEEIKKRMEQIRRTLALNIHLLQFTRKEFLSMLKTTEQNVGKEIIKNYIILKGKELLYEVMMHAR